MGTYLCFEVMMPDPLGRSGRNLERVDLLSYDTKGTWRFYELKITKSDFYSKNRHTFKGHLNYFVLPHDLYEKVKGDIPPEIGVYVARINEPYFCDCVKKAKRQPLQVDEEKLKFAFMQALSREHGKYRHSIREGDSLKTRVRALENAIKESDRDDIMPICHFCKYHYPIDIPIGEKHFCRFCEENQYWIFDEARFAAK